MDDRHGSRRGDGPRVPGGGGHVGDLAAAHALGALDPAEREAVEHHRRACPACDRLLAAEERAVSLLPFAVRAAPPPSPDVKVALLARVAQAQRAAGNAPLPPTLTIPASRPVPAPAAAGAGGGPDVRGVRWGGWATALLTAPLLVALVVTGAFAYQVRAEADERGDRAERFGAALDQALGGGAVHRLSPGPAAPEARGSVVTGDGQRSATFYMKADRARAGERYRLVADADGETVVLAAVTLDGRGRGVDALDLDRPLSGYGPFLVRGPGTEAGGPNVALWGAAATPVGDEGGGAATGTPAPAAPAAPD